MPDAHALPLPPTLAWSGGLDGELRLLDQTRLPGERRVLVARDLATVVAAIRSLAVRGAPAIGVAAAYGLYLGVREAAPSPGTLLEVARAVAATLVGARPTAVNLRWAVDRCLTALRRTPTQEALFLAATTIHDEDVAACRRLGEFGAPLVPAGGTVLTHCNTGRLATTGDGTALAVLFTAWARGTRFAVLADETRPLLQGARLTALELQAAGIPVRVLADGAAASALARGLVQLVVVGADRVAANGDFANKVGTYGLALAAAAHRVPFWVVAPWSTFEPELADGTRIPIEERDATEVTHCQGQLLAPVGVGAWNPAFDVTPGRLVTGFVTDRGLLSPPFPASIKGLAAAGR